jgi:hypothetical protein
MSNSYPSQYRDEPLFSDGSDNLANQGYLIEIEHVPSGESVTFKAFITSFNDTYAPNWTPEEVYGRADPIYNYKNTTRSITINFKMPAASESEAYANLSKAQKLAQFNYPNYSSMTCNNIISRTVSQAPLLRLKFINLIRSTADVTSDPNTYGNELYNSYNNGGKGILGFFSNITYNFNLENDGGGGFRLLEEIRDNEGNITTYQAKNGVLLPKLIDVTLGNFSPIHEQHLGWDENGIFSEGRSFPYGADSNDFTSRTAESPDSVTSATDEESTQQQLAESEAAQAEVLDGSNR